MIHLDVKQGSQEWLTAKVGRVSASNAHRILTPKTMKLSGQAEGYAHELIAEQILKRPLDDATTQFMQRGNLIEKSARDWYSLQTGNEVTLAGFVMRDDRRVGCSPDGLIASKGGLEIKCPSAAVHIGYLLGQTGENYRSQVQCCLWVTEREWWDFVSYNPDFPSALVRFQRDEEYIGKLAAAVEQFLTMMDDMKLALARLGHFPELAAQVPDLRVVA